MFLLDWWKLNIGQRILLIKILSWSELINNNNFGLGNHFFRKIKILFVYGGSISRILK